MFNLLPTSHKDGPPFSGGFFLPSFHTGIQQQEVKTKERRLRNCQVDNQKRTRVPEAIQRFFKKKELENQQRLNL